MTDLTPDTQGTVTVHLSVGLMCALVCIWVYVCVSVCVCVSCVRLYTCVSMYVLCLSLCVSVRVCVYWFLSQVHVCVCVCLRYVCVCIGFSLKYMRVCVYGTCVCVSHLSDLLVSLVAEGEAEVCQAVVAAALHGAVQTLEGWGQTGDTHLPECGRVCVRTWEGFWVCVWEHGTVCVCVCVFIYEHG